LDSPFAPDGDGHGCRELPGICAHGLRATTTATLKVYELVMVRVRVAVGIAHFVAAEVFGVTVPSFLAAESLRRVGDHFPFRPVSTTKGAPSVTCLRLLTPARANELIRRYGMRLALCTAMPSQSCANCGRPKSEHSKFDTFCLKLSGWTQEEFADTERRETRFVSYPVGPQSASRDVA
jgi:hypothetical protein